MAPAEGDEMIRSPQWMMIIAAVLAAGFIVILAAMHPRPAIPQEVPKKGDMEHRVRIIPIDRPPEAVPTPPPPIMEAPPVETHKTQAVTRPLAQNVCDRTGGRKVETNNGRSWHCEYNHRN